MVESNPPDTLPHCVDDVDGEPGRVASLRRTGMVAQFASLLLLNDVVPVEDDDLARRLFQRAGLSYSPDGTFASWLPASGIAFVGGFVLLALLCWWIRWNTNRLFFADHDASAPAPSTSCEEIWASCAQDEQMVLMQITREHIANPYQRPTIERLMARGLVRLAPDVQPFSKEFEAFLRKKERELEPEIKSWQHVDTLRSWRYGRLVLVCAVGAVGFFLFATQPGLQSSVMAVASGMAGVLSAGAKLREAVGSWFGRKAAA
jgi:hypothetical protein